MTPDELRRICNGPEGAPSRLPRGFTLQGPAPRSGAWVLTDGDTGETHELTRRGVDRDGDQETAPPEVIREIVDFIQQQGGRRLATLERELPLPEDAFEDAVEQAADGVVVDQDDDGATVVMLDNVEVAEAPPGSSVAIKDAADVVGKIAARNEAGHSAHQQQGSSVPADRSYDAAMEGAGLSSDGNGGYSRSHYASEVQQSRRAAENRGGSTDVVDVDKPRIEADRLLNRLGIISETGAFTRFDAYRVRDRRAFSPPQDRIVVQGMSEEGHGTMFSVPVTEGRVSIRDFHAMTGEMRGWQSDDAPDAREHAIPALVSSVLEGYEHSQKAYESLEEGEGGPSQEDPEETSDPEGPSEGR